MVDRTDLRDAVQDFEDCCKDLKGREHTERLYGEIDAYEELADELAEIYAEEPDINPDIDRVSRTIADISNTLTKTAIEEEITSEARQLRAEGRDDDIGRWTLDDWIVKNLDECRIVRTTDHIDSTRYIWDFGDVAVETSGGEEGRGHYSWMNFRDTIYEAGGPYCTDPNDPLTDPTEWRDWIVRQLDKVKEEKTNVGPRTSAVHLIQDKVRQAEAFETVGDAVTFQGVQVDVDDEPPDGEEAVNTEGAPQELPDWRVSVIRFPNQWAVDAAEEFGISTRALQNEIDARDYMLPGRSKVASREYAGGEYHTVWEVLGTFATPAAYHPEGEVEHIDGAAALEQTEQPTDADDFGAIGE